MFCTSLRGRKAFAVEQKIRELKTRIAKLFSQKLKSKKKNRNVDYQYEYLT